MAILDRENYMTRISALFPGDDDDSLSALEDLRDTYDDLAGRDNGDEVRRLTEENESLRRRYRERFDQQDVQTSPEKTEIIEGKTTFEELFKEVE